MFEFEYFLTGFPTTLWASRYLQKTANFYPRHTTFRRRIGMRLVSYCSLMNLRKPNVKKYAKYLTAIPSQISLHGYYQEIRGIFKLPTFSRRRIKGIECVYTELQRKF